MNCSFTTKQSAEERNAAFSNIPFHIINMEKGELQLDECTISNLIIHESALFLSSFLPSVIDSLTISNSTISKSLLDINECGQLTIKDFKTENISVEGNEESLISCLSIKKTMKLTNFTMGGVSSKITKGKLMKVEDCTDVSMDNCIFDGSSNERNEKNSNTEEEMCKWDGSLVDITKSSVVMKDTTLSNSPDGGITMSGGEMTVNDGRFENNNPSIEGYPSLRRNIICSNSGTLNVMSLKGGDGWERNTSLWMLNDGCSFEWIVSKRDSSFFISALEGVEAKEETDRMKLIFKGLLLIPCNLAFSVVKRNGEEKEIEHYDFDRNGFLSEREVEGSVAKDIISNCGDEIEVSVCVLFGNAESPLSTIPFVLKNKSEIEQKGDERIVEKENKIQWSLIAFIGCVIVVAILLFVITIIVVLKKKQNKGKRKIGDGEIEETNNIVRGEWRKEDVVQREEEEEDKMQVLLDGETGNKMGMSTEKVEELDVHENKEMVESGFDCEEVIGVIPVNYVEMLTVALLQSCGEGEGTESVACAGGIEDQNMRKRDGKAKRGKRRKGKKRKQVEEIDEIMDERGGCEIGFEEFGEVAAADDGRNGKQTEYYIRISSAPNSHFSMIGDDSEDQGMKRTMEEEKEVVEEREREEIGEEKQKRRKKKKKRNQKMEEKSEIILDDPEMGLLDEG